MPTVAPLVAPLIAPLGGAQESVETIGQVIGSAFAASTMRAPLGSALLVCFMSRDMSISSSGMETSERRVHAAQQLLRRAQLAASDVPAAVLQVRGGAAPLGEPLSDEAALRRLLAPFAPQAPSRPPPPPPSSFRVEL